MDKNKIVSVAVVVIVVLAVIGFFMFRGDGVAVPLTGSTESVATVNGVAIPKATYDTQLASALASLKTQGVDVENAEKLAQVKTQVLNDLISNELVNQGIVSAGIKATPEEIDTQVKAIVEQAGGQEKYNAELVKANITEAQLRDNVSKQIAVQKYLSANIDTSKVTVSDTEISKFYADYSKSQKDAGVKTVPTLKELSDQIKQQLTSDKQQALVNDFLVSLRAKAEVVISI